MSTIIDGRIVDHRAGEECCQHRPGVSCLVDHSSGRDAMWAQEEENMWAHKARLFPGSSVGRLLDMTPTTSRRLSVSRVRKVPETAVGQVSTFLTGLLVLGTSQNPERPLRNRHGLWPGVVSKVVTTSGATGYSLFLAPLLWLQLVSAGGFLLPIFLNTFPAETPATTV